MSCSYLTYLVFQSRTFSNIKTRQKVLDQKQNERNGIRITLYSARRIFYRNAEDFIVSHLMEKKDDSNVG